MKLMKTLSPGSPLWLAGFRPFFTLGILMGILLPAIWGLGFSGKLPLSFEINPFQWHAHEMLFGYGGAVLIGFLLTASKNWVKVRGIHGAPLMILVGFWIFERIFLYFAFDLPPVIKHLGMSLFIGSSGLYIINTLIKHRLNDSFKDNYFFIALLTLIILAKNLLLSGSYYQHGIAMTVGLFRLAFAVMFERTITQFMKNTEGVELYRNRVLDLAIKFSILLSVFQSFLPKPVAVTTLLLASALLFVRWILWRPDLGFRKFGNATMYIGYLGLTLHFAFEASRLTDFWSVGTISLHTFTFLCMGVVIASMLVRIGQGHTGRKPQFLTLDKLAISLILGAAAFRLLLSREVE